MLLAQLFLCIAEVRLGLAGDERTCNPDLALDPGYGLPCHLPHHVRNTWNVGPSRGLAAELLDAARDGTLVIACLLQVLPEALLVGLLLGQGNMRRQVGLQLRLLCMRFV